MYRFVNNVKKKCSQCRSQNLEGGQVKGSGANKSVTCHGENLIGAVSATISGFVVQ